MRRPNIPRRGPEPIIYPVLQAEGHGDVYHGLWHTRMVQAWQRAWASDLIGQVEDHGDGLYSIPSQTVADRWYCVHRYPLAPDGYLYLCDCDASQKGGVVCAHGMAVYLWRLRHVMGYRLKRPGGADARSGKQRSLEEPVRSSENDSRIAG